MKIKMPAFIDVRCAKCGRKYGWFGEIMDQPNCPKCGHPPDKEKLKTDEAHFKEIEELLLSRPHKNIARKQRKLAGLTIGQASKLLEIDVLQLAAIERGEVELTEDIKNMMSQIYQVGK